MRKILLISAVLVLVMAGCRGKGNSKSENAASTTVSEVVADAHTSQNALDYEGVYKGILPCADCEGIATTITIDRESNYSIEWMYLGKGGNVYSNSGKYKWSRDGRIIELQGVDVPNKYQVGENVLFYLDRKGKRITGDNAEMYMLRKQ